MASALPYADLVQQLVGLLLVIALPLLPAILIYWAIPRNRSDVSGPFKGLKLKLGGAFGAYFVTALLAFTVFSFITKSGLSASRAAERDAKEKIKELSRDLAALRLEVGRQNNALADGERVSLTTKNDTLARDLAESQSQLAKLREGLQGEAYEVWTVSGHVDFDSNPLTLRRSSITISVKPAPFIHANGWFNFAVLVPKGIGATYPSIMFEKDGYSQDEISLHPGAQQIKGTQQYSVKGRGYELRPVTLELQDSSKNKPYDPSPAGATLVSKPKRPKGP